MPDGNYTSKYTRTVVVIVRLPDFDEDPTAIDSCVLNVTDRQILYALQRFVEMKRIELIEALKSARRRGRKNGTRLLDDNFDHVIDAVRPPPPTGNQNPRNGETS